MQTYINTVVYVLAAHRHQHRHTQTHASTPEPSVQTTFLGRTYNSLFATRAYRFGKASSPPPPHGNIMMLLKTSPRLAERREIVHIYKHTHTFRGHPGCFGCWRHCRRRTHEKCIACSRLCGSDAGAWMGGRVHARVRSCVHAHGKCLPKRK